MTLREKQSLFAELFAGLVLYAVGQGYEITLGEAHRPAWVAIINAQEGRGIADSLHTSRLAVDINLFRNGHYLSSTLSHRPLGEWWESQHELCRWGGRFNDGNHYSLTHGGRS